MRLQTSPQVFVARMRIHRSLSLISFYSCKIVSEMFQKRQSDLRSSFCSQHRCEMLVDLIGKLCASLGSGSGLVSRRSAQVSKVTAWDWEEKRGWSRKRQIAADAGDKFINRMWDDSHRDSFRGSCPRGRSASTLTPVRVSEGCIHTCTCKSARKQKEELAEIFWHQSVGETWSCLAYLLTCRWGSSGSPF